MQLVSLILIHWIVIYPVDSAIQRLNNWSQGGNYIPTCAGYWTVQNTCRYPGGGGGTPYSGLYGEAPPERGAAFFKLAV